MQSVNPRAAHREFPCVFKKVPPVVATLVRACRYGVDVNGNSRCEISAVFWGARGGVVMLSIGKPRPQLHQGANTMLAFAGFGF